MIKKVCLVLLPALSLLLYSCGSTKQEAQDVLDSEALVEAPAVEEPSEEEETATDNADENTQENGIASEDEVSTDAEASGTNDETENIEELYPPLEEIEEPDFIEISPEEIEEQEAAKAALAEQEEIEKNKITEPVEEQEELPPLPESDDQTEDGIEAGSEGNAATSTQDDETDQTQEEISIEPVIEVQTEEEAEPEPEILPSRSVSLKKGETLVITYPGNGWIYMGSTSEYNNLASRGRKLGTTDTKYTLLAKEAGTQIHHFYKVDNLTGEYIDDYIEVTVLEKKGNSSTVVNAPDYSKIVPKKPETPAKATPKKTTVQNEEVQESDKEAGAGSGTTAATATAATSTATDAATTKTTATTKATTSAKTTSTTSAKAKTPEKEEVIEIEPEDSVIVIDEEETEETVNLEPLLEKARTGISSKKFDEVYTSLTQYLEFSTDNRDEALYLLGQLLESDSKYKDIKKAVETYQTLCDSYPASKYWENANKRIVYLKRFYINIH